MVKESQKARFKQTLWQYKSALLRRLSFLRQMGEKRFSFLLSVGNSGIRSWNSGYETSPLQIPAHEQGSALKRPGSSTKVRFSRWIDWITKALDT
jgi:hypothetical protein